MSVTPRTAVNGLCIEVSLARPQFALKVQLELPAKGITVLYGPSGSGKTTLLRCVAGLEHPQGRVAIGEQTWQHSAHGVFIPTWQRRLGYVFQEASLFEHMDVRRNLEYGVRRVRAPQSQAALRDAIGLLGIEHLLERSPQSLSGGERQRVAIARALATQPNILLLDEPLASLDPARRKDILPWLERMHRELEIPALYVTHSADELARLADHVVMLDQGCVTANGILSDVLADVHVAMAAGEEAGIVTQATIVAKDEGFGLARAQLDGGSLWVRDQGLTLGSAIRMRVLARDVSLSLSEASDSTIQNRIRGMVQSIDQDVHPSQALVRVRCGETLMLARVTHRALQELKITVGSAVWCQVKSVALMQ